MSNPLAPVRSSGLPLELFPASADVIYTLDATAHLAGVSRRSVLIYCRAGLIEPVFQPPHGVMVFTEESVYAVRRFEELRAVHKIGLPWLKAMFDLRKEVDRLRAELRFLGKG